MESTKSIKNKGSKRMCWSLPNLQNYMLELKQRFFVQAGSSYLLTEVKKYKSNFASEDRLAVF
jgi:hypothetical protein